MIDIFITYASADRSRAEEIASLLTGEGWSVWWDRHIPPGKYYDDIIEAALDSAKCVVVLWTTNSIFSDWVKTEAAEGARRRILVPVLLDDVKIPLEFRRIQAAELTNWKTGKAHPEIKALFHSIDEILGRRSSFQEENHVDKKEIPDPIRDDGSGRAVLDSNKKIIKKLLLIQVFCVWIVFILFAFEPDGLPPFLIMWLILLIFLAAFISGISLAVISARIRFYYSTAMGVISSLGYLYSSTLLIDIRNGAAILGPLLVFGLLVLVLGLFVLFRLCRLKFPANINSGK